MTEDKFVEDYKAIFEMLGQPTEENLEDVLRSIYRVVRLATIKEVLDFSRMKEISSEEPI